MIVAGIGCRRLCPPEANVALVEAAQQQGGWVVQALAAPAFKHDEPGLADAALRLGLPLHFVAAAALAAVQHRCVSKSQAAVRATGIASVAEGAALAASGGPLLLPRIANGWATCALAGS